MYHRSRCVVFLLIVVAVAATCLAADTPEEKAWQKVDGMSVSSLKAYLAKFPDGEHAPKARAALELHREIARLRAGEIQPKYVIPFDMLEPKWSEWRSNSYRGQIRLIGKQGEFDGFCRAAIGQCFNIEQWIAGKSGLGGSYVPLPGHTVLHYNNQGHPCPPSGDGSIWFFASDDGTSCQFFPKLAMQVPKGEELIFCVLDRVGLVYLKGKGKLTYEDGREVVLPPAPKEELHEGAEAVQETAPKSIVWPETRRPPTLRSRLCTNLLLPSIVGTVTLGGEKYAAWVLLSADGSQTKQLSRSGRLGLVLANSAATPGTEKGIEQLAEMLRAVKFLVEEKGTPVEKVEVTIPRGSYLLLRPDAGEGFWQELTPSIEGARAPSEPTEEAFGQMISSWFEALAKFAHWPVEGDSSASVQRVQVWRITEVHCDRWGVPTQIVVSRGSITRRLKIQF